MRENLAKQLIDKQKIKENEIIEKLNEVKKNKVFEEQLLKEKLEDQEKQKKIKQIYKEQLENQMCDKFFRGEETKKKQFYQKDGIYHFTEDELRSSTSS